MDIFDPGTEVWICPCGAPRSEPGLCLQCRMERMERAEGVSMRPLMWGIYFLLVLIGLGLIGAVVLMFHAAWLAHKTFTGIQ